MLGLPKTTEFNKRIPKTKFYDNLSVNTALKNAIKSQIKTIYWKNKIAATTMNIAQGNNVTELEVFEIHLNNRALDEDVLRQIDKQIPYRILFLLKYEDKYQIWIGYKEAAKSGKNAFKVSSYYHTDWLTEEKIMFKAEGFTVDDIYENFVKQIAGTQLTANAGESLNDTVVRTEKKAKLKKRIDSLQKKIRKEKQFNRQMEMNTELKKLKKEMEEL